MSSRLRQGHGGALQRGFALAATVWFLAIITLMAGTFATWVSRSVNAAWEQRQDAETLIDLRGTRDTLLFIAATQPLNSGGFVLPGTEVEAVRSLARPDAGADPFTSTLPSATGGELSLAGRAYQGLRRARFALQDEAGLLNPNSLERQRLDRLLGLLGVEASDRGPLLDKLRDYVTEGDLRSLYGANAADYVERDLPPPPDRYLLSAMEASRILDWGDYSILWESGLWRDHVTVTVFGGVNLNTAPALILRTDPFIDEQDALEIIEERQRLAFFSPEDAARRTGVPLGGSLFAFVTYPSRNFRMTLWHEGASQGIRYHYRLTPQSEQGAPWELDQMYPVDRYGLSPDEPANIDDAIFSAQAESGSP
jgi:hypothetical protein